MITPFISLVQIREYDMANGENGAADAAVICLLPLIRCYFSHTRH